MSQAKGVLLTGGVVTGVMITGTMMMTGLMATGVMATVTEGGIRAFAAQYANLRLRLGE